MNPTISPKTIVITGSSSGFGALTARALAARGHRVVATMRDSATRNLAVKASLEAFAEQGRHQLQVADMDVTSETSVQTAIAAIVKSTGRIDVLLNNAGVMNVGTAALL
jgi:NAD(P)-dependent dehydrogenase (short-subunit alcohol dehydrogenase family)